MHILEPNRYDRARPLFAALDDQLAAVAILDGATPGRIYVDDPDHPTAAFTWTRHRLFLAGSPANSDFSEGVRRLFAETIYPQAPAWGLEMFELNHTPTGWAEVIPGFILRDRESILARRHHYVFRELKHNWRRLLPQGYRLAFIDADLLAQEHIRHLEDLREELCSERPSVEDFLARSFGIVALCGDELAGWCTSEYNSRDRCEVGIGTLAPYQRRGVATAMGSAFVEHAQAQGVARIGWHCWANNLPSIAAALKIGYELAAEYTTYIAWFDRPPT
jgi:RimJ/RimL family protein N-acetyltransferase